MSCPLCGSRCYSMTNGCQSCGYYPTRIEIDREQAQLLAKVRAARNRSREAVEFGGISVNTNQGDRCRI